jgi:hypothetical protein
MKVQYVFLATTFLLSTYIYSQMDSTKIQFLELVSKVQNDKTLMGTLMFKGYTADISEYKEYASTIGKFIKIEWTGVSKKKFTAIFHNTLGYMTRRVFSAYKTTFRDYKVDKDKYCKDDVCYEMLDDKKLPYIFIYYRSTSEIKTIN